MKKLIAGLLFVAGIAGAACMGPYCYDDTGAKLTGISTFALPTYSSTTISGITPAAVGQLVVCNTCPNAGTYSVGVCVSTATNKAAWVMISSTSVSCQ